MREIEIDTLLPTILTKKNWKKIPLAVAINDYGNIILTIAMDYIKGRITKRERDRLFAFRGKELYYVFVNYLKIRAKEKKVFEKFKKPTEEAFELVSERIKKECAGCKKGLPQIILDEDGVDVTVSNKPGKICHAFDDNWFECTTTPKLFMKEALSYWNKNHEKQTTK